MKSKCKPEPDITSYRHLRPLEQSKETFKLSKRGRAGFPVAAAYARTWCTSTQRTGSTTAPTVLCLRNAQPLSCGNLLKRRAVNRECPSHVWRMQPVPSSTCRRTPPAFRGANR